MAAQMPPNEPTVLRKILQKPKPLPWSSIVPIQPPIRPPMVTPRKIRPFILIV